MELAEGSRPVTTELAIRDEASAELAIRDEASAEVTLYTPKQVQAEVETQLGDLLCVLGQEEQKVSVLSDELVTLGRDPQSILAKYGLDDASLDAVRDFSTQPMLCCWGQGYSSSPPPCLGH
jgi:hypothetical protein